MAETSYPFDNANAGEVEWSRMARLWWGKYGVNGGPGATSLAVSADGSGTRQVYIQPGVAQVIGFRYETDTLITLSAGANVSGNPRIDRVVLRLNTTSNTVTCVIKAGTPAASPTPPTLDATDAGFEMSLAQIFVAPGATTLNAPNVTDERVWIGLRAATVASLTSPVPADLQPGAPVWVADRARQLVYAGAVAGIIDPRKPQLYAGVQTGNNLIGGGTFTAVNIVTLTVPASANAVGNRYLEVTAKLFLNLANPGDIVQAFLIANGTIVDGSQFTASESQSFAFAANVGPAAYPLTLQVQRISGTGNVTVSVLPGFLYLKATATPTD